MTDLSPRERRLDRDRLQDWAGRLKNQAAACRNGGSEKRAGELLDLAGAIKRLIAENDALRLELKPEGLPGQILESITDMGS